MKIVAFSQTHLNLGSRPIEWRTLTSNKHLLVPEDVMARLEWAYLPFAQALASKTKSH